jgi:hypothetical protein
MATPTGAGICQRTGGRLSNRPPISAWIATRDSTADADASQQIQPYSIYYVGNDLLLHRAGLYAAEFYRVGSDVTRWAISRVSSPKAPHRTMTAPGLALPHSDDIHYG